MKQQAKTNSISYDLKLIQDNSEIFCYHCGSKNYIKKGSPRGKQLYLCKNCKHHFYEGVTKESRYLQNLPSGDDVWPAEELGLRINKHTNRSKLIFLYIQQNWLKEAAQKYVRYSATTKQFTTLTNFIGTINCFSKFIAEKHPYLTWKTLDRNIIIDYLAYLNSKHLAGDTKTKKISNLKQLLETGKINSWFQVPSYLIRLEDYPKPQKSLPRYIPEEVMGQLNQHLPYLPEPVIRMVLVIQETGLRLGELLQLSIDCLKQDRQGDWSIQYRNWKMTKEDLKPISQELAKVIQEQQQYIRDNLSQEFAYLFCGRKSKKGFYPKPKVMSSASFINFLKRLAKENNICDNSGKIWNFQSHQFRHTVGTRMINNGVPQHIVQKYLGHESPTMTMRYAHIYDETLKKEISKYHESRVVNIAGEIVESKTPELDQNLDLHLLKKKVLPQALPNGSCGRPIVLGECPHANACLTCGDFRTTREFLEQHKSQLESTKKIIKNAEEKGWKRHAEMNKRVENNLEKIINTLESGDKDLVAGAEE